MGPGGPGFKYSGESSRLEIPKVSLGRRLKKMPETCKERLWESSPPRPAPGPSSSEASPTGLAEGCPAPRKGQLPSIPSAKSPPGEVSCRGYAFFLVGRWAQKVLGWQQLGPRTCRSSSPASQTHAPAKLGAASRWPVTYAFTPLWAFFFLI